MRKMICILGLTTMLALAVEAQVSGIYASERAASAHVIVPQARSFLSSAASGRIEVIGVEAGVEIREQIATTTLDIILTNSSSAALEAELAVPVPDGAALRGFTFQGAGKEPVAELLQREEARRTYDAIVAKVRDPAILEFLGCNLIRSSVFPVSARAGQKVRIVYEHLLPRDGDRIDYVLPRSESVEYMVPWKIAVRINCKQAVSTVYSPSHRIDTVRNNPSSVTARLASGAENQPGPFRLSLLLRSKDMAASLMAYPSGDVGGGYFLLLAGAPERSPRSPSIKREVILVIDRSGSMAGEKLEQARAAALQVLEGLDDGERFNVIVYNEGVECFARDPVEKTHETMRAARTFLRDLRVRGGTNIYDALQEALRMRSSTGFLPLVLFLTDGLPTVGQTSEKAIRDLATKANPQRRRIFAFGIGLDVNTPLLDKLAVGSRAASTYVLPREDIEVKVAQVFRRLSGPVLIDPILSVENEDGTAAYGRVHESLPGRLPDLFEGDQLIVLGQYRGEKSLCFELKGEDGDRTRTFRFRFDPKKASTRNAFVPRLWASRKIAVLTDAIRDLGAEQGLASGGRADLPTDPRMKELVEEVVRLSRQFGVLSEYTAFLAREGTDLTGPPDAFVQAYANFDKMAVSTRSGIESVTQSLNNNYARAQTELNGRNSFYDSNMNQVQIANVQQLNDGAFYRRGNRWVESSLLDDTNVSAPRVVQVGSEEFRRLVERLATENKQAAAALNGEILLRVGAEKVLIR